MYSLGIILVRVRMTWVGTGRQLQDPAGRPGRGKGEVLVYISGKRQALSLSLSLSLSGKRISTHNRNCEPQPHP